MENNDKILWKSFVEGDDHAYSELYEHYFVRMYNFGRQFTSDRFLIEDVIHDIFVTIYSNREKLPGITNPRQYMLTSIRNGVFTALKKQGGKSVDIACCDTQYGHTPEIAETPESSSRSAGVASKFETLLSKRQKEVVAYRYIDQLSIKEISSAMSITQQTVKNILHIAVKKLRKSND